MKNERSLDKPECYTSLVSVDRTLWVPPKLWSCYTDKGTDTGLFRQLKESPTTDSEYDVANSLVFHQRMEHPVSISMRVTGNSVNWSKEESGPPKLTKRS